MQGGENKSEDLMEFQSIVISCLLMSDSIIGIVQLDFRGYFILQAVDTEAIRGGLWMY